MLSWNCLASHLKKKSLKGSLAKCIQWYHWPNTAQYFKSSDMIKGSHLISYQSQITRRLMSNQYHWTQFCQPAILLLTYCEISLFLELSSKLGSSSAYEWNNYLKSWLKQNLKIWMLWSFVTLNLKHSSFNQQKFKTTYLIVIHSSIRTPI